jgi:hypothetical protein
MERLLHRPVDRGHPEVTTMHLKEGYIRRNGLPASYQRTFAEYLMRRDNGYLTWVTIIDDPCT